MTFWLNAIQYGQLAPSQSFATRSAARAALSASLARERQAGREVREESIGGIAVWTVRNADGSVHGSWWLSDAEQGPALRLPP